MENEAEEYREKIVGMVSKIKSKSTLKYLFIIINTYLKSRGI